MIGTLVEIVVSGYGSMVGTFGSPLIQMAIAATLIALAVLDLYVKRHAKPSTEAN